MNGLPTLLSQYGITNQMLIWILYVPVLATLVNLIRYVVGIKSYGIYAPIALSFAYIFTGIRFGLLITIAVVISTLITYRMLMRVRMHYISRISMSYIVISVVVVLVMILNEISPISLTTTNHELSAITPLGIVMIISLADFFVKQYVRKSLSSSLRTLGETILIAVIGWALLRWVGMQNYLLNNLWLLPVLLVANLFVGQYTGMRLKEIFRFKRILDSE